MKISVLGNIIDTELIYKISPIKKTENIFFNFYFTICFFNNKELEVKLDTGIYLKNNYLIIRKSNYENYNSSREEVLNRKEYLDELVRIKNLRNKVIEYWNTSKSEIPMLEFEEEI